MSDLSMRQMMAIVDDQGRYRCPLCGRYAKLEDFPKQQGSFRIPDGIVSTLPGCRKCVRQASERKRQ